MIDLGRVRRQAGRLQPGPLLPVSLACLAAAAAAVLLAGAGSAGAAASECPSSNPPNMLAVAAGSPQTAQLGQAFQTNLQVALANSNGCPVTGQLAGVSVDLSAPASGASGTFATSGTNRVTVGTDATGVATAPVFTANDNAGSYSVQADSAYGRVMLHLTNSANGVPASINASGPARQTATVKSRYGHPLRAQVLDANGRPVQGVSVSFSLGAGAGGAGGAESAGASFLDGASQATATTNALGQAASPPFVANATPGNFTATASVGGTGQSTTSGLQPVTYGLRNLAGTLTTGGRTALSTVVKSRYRQRLKARLSDASGRPIEGVTVTFSLPAADSDAGASFLGGESQATGLTDASGRASSPPLVANSTAGRFTASAAVAGSAKSVRYVLRNLAGRPTTITAGGASGQSAPTGARFPIRLAVTVTDANGNEVAGAVVAFTAPARGPSGHFTSRPAGRTDITRKSRTVRVKTNGKGIAIAPAFTANHRPGGYIVTATTGGRRAAFALVNRPR
jgi:hypothetical protein